jgi:glucokinase
LATIACDDRFAIDVVSLPIQATSLAVDLSEAHTHDAPDAHDAFDLLRMNDLSHPNGPVPSLPSPPPSYCALPRPWLLADIGGTNARFGWLAAGSDEIAHVMTLRGTEHSSVGPAAQAYLRKLQLLLGAHDAAPGAAAFAVATPVTGDDINFTNSGWAFSRQALRHELGLQDLLVLNDFEALALSLPGLRSSQVLPIVASHTAVVGPGQAQTPVQRATLAVIGPGTGLGVAGLVPTQHGWVAVPGEGGHASLSAADDFEVALLQAVRSQHPHVSAERLLSGIGLPVLHAAVAQVLGRSAQARAALAGSLTANAIVERALTGGDEVCSRTIDSFCALLGSFAGNVALVLGARGGVYIGGGIVPRLGERFFSSQFRQRFEAKGRFEPYLQAVPTALITDTLAALGGTALALEQHGR